jgi:hypothetical protein
LGAILTPHDIFHGGSVKLGDGLLLLDVVKNNRTGGAEDKTGGAAIEDFVRLNRRFYALDDSAGQIADLDVLPRNKINHIPLQACCWHTCVVLLRIANLLRATNMALCPGPRFPSSEESFNSPEISLGRLVSSYNPLSDEMVNKTARSAGL